MKSLEINKGSDQKINRLAVIGAGPIGLFYAISLAKIRYDVDIYEKSSLPRDKTCGQGLMPSGLSLLNRVGINFNHGEDCYNFNKIEYIDGDYKLIGELKDYASGIERRVLSQKLFDRAQTFSNINIFQNSSINDLDQLSGYKFIFACDGLNSNTRDLVNNTKIHKRNKRIGARVHFDQAPWSDSVLVYWGNRVEAYVTPVSRSKIEVAFLWYDDALDRGGNLENRLFQKFPDLCSSLNFDFQCSDFKAYGPFIKSARAIKSKNIFFIGDAYYFEDGITGEGLSLGFKSSNILSHNSENFSLIAHLKVKALYLNYKIWVRLALIMSRYSKFRALSLRLLIKFRFIFDSILNLNDLNF